MSKKKNYLRSLMEDVCVTTKRRLDALVKFEEFFQARYHYQFTGLKCGPLTEMFVSGKMPEITSLEQLDATVLIYAGLVPVYRDENGVLINPNEERFKREYEAQQEKMRILRQQNQNPELEQIAEDQEEKTDAA